MSPEEMRFIYIGVPSIALLIAIGIALGFYYEQIYKKMIFYHKKMHKWMIFYHKKMYEMILFYHKKIIFFYKQLEITVADTRLKLVIDHDGGADDAFAITLCLLNEKYFGGPDVVALTTTFGNIKVSQTIMNSDRILGLCDRQDIPIYSGAHKGLISEENSDFFFGSDGLGDLDYIPPTPIITQKKHASIALLELSKKYEGRLIIIAIGPLTNIALAVRMDPKFIQRLAHLYIGGGHIYSEKYPSPEFNALMDPEAYHIVANSFIPDKVTIVPFSQVYDTASIPIDWRVNVLGKIQTPVMQALNSFERLLLPKWPTWNSLDPATVAVALDDDFVTEFKHSSNGIILQGEKRGITTNDFLSANPNVRIAYTIDMERYKSFMVDVYSAELRQRKKKISRTTCCPTE